MIPNQDIINGTSLKIYIKYTPFVQLLYNREIFS